MYVKTVAFFTSGTSFKGRAAASPPLRLSGSVAGSSAARYQSWKGPSAAFTRNVNPEGPSFRFTPIDCPSALPGARRATNSNTQRVCAPFSPTRETEGVRPGGSLARNLPLSALIVGALTYHRPGWFLGRPPDRSQWDSTRQTPPSFSHSCQS